MQKTVLGVFCALILATPANCQELRMSAPRDPEPKEIRERRFWEYKSRRAERRANALAIRRRMNAGKVHRYWTAIHRPVNPTGTPAIQRGWIVQPPIDNGRSWRYWLDLLIDEYVPSGSH